jgi:spore maturation protein CgeB
MPIAGEWFPFISTCSVKVFFLKSHTFLAREFESALARCPGLQTVTVTIAVYPDTHAVERLEALVHQHNPAVVYTINDAGYDTAGHIERMLHRAGVYRVNWYHDDPFYEYMYNVRTQPIADGRMDFVSEASFVPRLRNAGRDARFLPLATDPDYFNTSVEVPYTYDVAFVGNSSLPFIDTLITPAMEHDIANNGALVNDLHRRYRDNPRTDIRAVLQQRRNEWQHTLRSDPQRFMFTLEWLIGYFSRRDMITALAERFGDRFMCFGDAYWARFIDEKQVSTDACYYTNLCEYYRRTKINININRIQIKTAFTQRIFDCKAAGAFILTERRACNEKFFITRGPDRELVEFDSLAHCIQLCEFFLTHPQQRERIARNGRQKVLQRHTYDARLAQIVRECNETWGL